MRETLQTRTSKRRFFMLCIITFACKLLPPPLSCPLSFHLFSALSCRLLLFSSHNNIVLQPLPPPPLLSSIFSPLHSSLLQNSSSPSLSLSLYFSFSLSCPLSFHLFTVFSLLLLLFFC